MAQPEAQLQGAVVAFLRGALPPRALVFAVPNGGSRDKREAAKLKWQGVLAGVPDLIVLIDRQCFGIELKARTGRLTDEQKLISCRFEDNQIPWTVARSIDEVETFLRGHGVPLRSTVLAA